MKVDQNTTKLYFVSEFSDTVDVTITNQESKVVTFNKTLSVTKESFYNVITDANFNFKKNQIYIINIFASIFINDFEKRVEDDEGTFESDSCCFFYLSDLGYEKELIYRGTIYSNVDDIYLQAKKINSQNEYITV